MNLRSRLNKMETGLTAKERVKLRLHALKEGREAGVSDRAGMLGSESQETQRLWATVSAVNLDLSLLVDALFQRTLRFQDLLHSFWLTQAWAKQTAQVLNIIANTPALKEPISQARVGQSPESDLTRSLKEIHAVLLPGLPGPDGPLPLSFRVAGSSEHLKATMATELAECWTDLRALEKVLDAIAIDLDGKDPLHPDYRTTLENCKSLLQDVKGVLDDLRIKAELREPSEEKLDRFCYLVELASGSYEP